LGGGNMADYDVVIIGRGVGGLTLALKLVQANMPRY
jgi:flavin-dependent dehydrogenase